MPPLQSRDRKRKLARHQAPARPVKVEKQFPSRTGAQFPGIFPNESCILSSLTASLAHGFRICFPATTALQELTFNENDDDKPTILRVAPGSPAEAAGLRTAQRVLSMEDVSLHGQPAALEVLANIRQSEEAGFVKLTIGDIRPERSQVHQVIRGQRGSSHDPYVNENCCAATLCYCTLLGQLWQHVMKGPRASCVIIAIALWLLFLLGLLLAVVAINHVQRDQGSHANLCRNRQQCSGGINLAPPAPPSAPMPVETRLQVPIPLLAAAYALIFWCASSLLLVRIRDVLRKESAQEWRPAMVQKAEDAEASKINRDPNRSPRRSNDPSRPIHGRRCAWLRRRWLRLPPRPFIGCYSVGERLEEASGCYGFSLLGPFLCGFGLAGRILFFLRVPQDSYRFCAPLDSVAGPLAPRPAYAV